MHSFCATRYQLVHGLVPGRSPGVGDRCLKRQVCIVLSSSRVLFCFVWSRSCLNLKIQPKHQHFNQSLSWNLTKVLQLLHLNFFSLNRNLRHFLDLMSKTSDSRILQRNSQTETPAKKSLEVGKYLFFPSIVSRCYHHIHVNIQPPEPLPPPSISRTFIPLSHLPVCTPVLFIYLPPISHLYVTLS